MSLTAHAIAAIALTIGALLLLSRERIPMEYSSAAIVIVLVTGFELFPVAGPQPLRGANFLAGFGNEALITICLLLILAKGVETTGALRIVARFLTRIWLVNRSLALLLTLATAGFVSAFVNNTPIVVMFLPVLVGVAHRIGIVPSKMLMPVGFATIVGGMCTTIGTSTNLLVVSVAADSGLPRMGMFDFALPAVLTAVVGLLYLWAVLPRILPERTTLLGSTEPRMFDSVVSIGSESVLANVTLSHAMRLLGEGIRIYRIQRADAIELVRLPTLKLQEGDKLSVRGSPGNIHAAHDIAGTPKFTDDMQRTPDERLVEIVVTPDSPLHAKRLSQLQPDTLRGLYPIGWYRPRQGTTAQLEKFTDPLLRTGDVLLMQGPRQDIQDLMDASRILMLARTIHLPRVTKTTVSIAIMTGVVVLAALGVMPIVASALCGVGLMLISRCLTWNEAWTAIDTRLVLVIVASLSLGTALVGTGAAAFIANAFVGVVAGLPGPVVLCALLLLTALLTEVVTNNAIAVIATPIAIAVASQLGLPPVPFVLAVLFGANMSFLTPIGYQTNLLVMGAGGYRFSDFFRGGLPLQILLWLAASFFLTVFYL